MKWYSRMARVALWAVLVVLVSLFLMYYLDTPVPEEIPEKLKVRLLDASMRTYGHVISGLVKVGLTTHFSTLDRKISDWFVLTQMTGSPWGMSLTADQRVKINDTDLGGVRVKVYEPVSSIRSDYRPALVFLHGGGWSLLSVDSYDPLIRKLAIESGVVIFSVDYRLSPQFPYPVPLEDCLKVVNFVLDNPYELRIDPSRVAVGGDSAGGNLAASVSLRLRDQLAMQFLIVPFLQAMNFKTTSFVENTPYFHDSINNPASVVFVTNYIGISPSYTTDFLQNNHTSQSLKRSKYARYVDQSSWMNKELIRNQDLISELGTSTAADHGNEILSDLIEKHITDPYFAPLMADDAMLHDLPEAYVITAGYDYIRDDGVMYAARLKAAGTPVIHKHYAEGFHNAWFFPHGPLKVEVAVSMVRDMVKALKESL